MSSHNPTLAKRSLGDQLRRARTAKGLDEKDVAELAYCDTRTIRRFESGETTPKPLMVEKLCSIYKLPPEQMSVLTRMALESKKHGWWEGYKAGASPTFPLYAEHEQEAALIRTWEPEHMPGLVQTRDYLEAVQANRLPMDEERKRAIQGFRFKRQELFFARTDKFEVRFLVGLAAIKYLDDQPAEAKDGQVSRLRDVDALPRFNIRVVTSLHASMDGGFTILTPRPAGQTSPPFVFLDALDGCRYVEDTEVVSRYEQAFDATWQIATSVKEYLR